MGYMISDAEVYFFMLNISFITALHFLGGLVGWIMVWTETLKFIGIDCSVCFFKSFK